MRPIDGDSVVQQIKEFAECNQRCAEKFYEGQGCKVCVFGKIIRMISNEPTIKPYGTWIPCSERLPKKGSYIKVQMSFSNHVSSYTKIAHWAEDKFVWDNGREIKDKPDAWMPFFAPEPYREEKK